MIVYRTGSIDLIKEPNKTTIMVNLRKWQNFLEKTVDVAQDAYEVYESQQAGGGTSGGSSSTSGGTKAATDSDSAAAAANAANELDDGANIPLSTCTGNKKSLFIGINYVGSSAELHGCINDVINIKKFVVDKFGFPTDEEHMRTLTDDNPSNMPTKDNILEAFKWLVEGAADGDSLFLHYSGHGAYQKGDKDGDEIGDAQDETIVPVDYEKNGQIVDDLIHEMLVASLPQGVRLTCIMDCCHSGSVFDLPFTYGVDGKNEIVETDNRKAVIEAAMKAGMSLLQGNKKAALEEGMKALTLHFMPGSGGGGSGGGGGNGEPSAKQIELRSTVADVIQFSGCQDSQTSADARIDGKASGAMSWSFMKAFDDHGMDQSYIDLLKNIRTLLSGKYSQVPQMSTGHKMDMTTSFKM